MVATVWTCPPHQSWIVGDRVGDGDSDGSVHRPGRQHISRNMSTCCVVTPPTPPLVEPLSIALFDRRDRFIPTFVQPAIPEPAFALRLRAP